VLLPCALLCGGGIVIGAPLVWVFGQIIAASQGASSPAVAVDTYLMALSYEDDAGRQPVLDRRPGRRPDGPVEGVPGGNASGRYRTVEARSPDPPDQAHQRGTHDRRG
jgi:hypothetical protein